MTMKKLGKRGMMCYLQKLSGLDWTEMAQLFGFSDPKSGGENLKSWAYGARIGSTLRVREVGERDDGAIPLAEMLTVMRAADRGSPEANRAMLLSEVNGVRNLDVLRKDPQAFLRMVGLGPTPVPTPTASDLHRQAVHERRSPDNSPQARAVTDMHRFGLDWAELGTFFGVEAVEVQTWAGGVRMPEELLRKLQQGHAALQAVDRGDPVENRGLLFTRTEGGVIPFVVWCETPFSLPSLVGKTGQGEDGRRVMELQRWADFTWAELRVLLVEKYLQAVRGWANGEPMPPEKAEKLGPMLAALRRIDQGSPQKNHDLIFTEDKGELLFYALARDPRECVTRAKELLRRQLGEACKTHPPTSPTIDDHSA